jgi:hypothetical protein
VTRQYRGGGVGLEPLTEVNNGEGEKPGRAIGVSRCATETREKEWRVSRRREATERKQKGKWGVERGRKERAV